MHLESQDLLRFHSLVILLLRQTFRRKEVGLKQMVFLLQQLLGEEPIECLGEELKQVLLQPLQELEQALLVRKQVRLSFLAQA